MIVRYLVVFFVSVGSFSMGFSPAAEGEFGCACSAECSINRGEPDLTAGAGLCHLREGALYPDAKLYSELEEVCVMIQNPPLSNNSIRSNTMECGPEV